MTEAEKRAYRAAVAALPPLTGAAFRLHRVDGLNYIEIAARLNVDTERVTFHISPRPCAPSTQRCKRHGLDRPGGPAPATVANRQPMYTAIT